METKNVTLLMKNYFMCTMLLLITGITLAQTQTNLLPPDEFQQRIKKEKGILVDVRTPAEYDKGHIGNARLINFFDDDFESKINQLNKDSAYFVYCGVGGRSEETVELMKKHGFKKVYDLEGGIARWKKEGFPVEQATSSGK